MMYNETMIKADGFRTTLKGEAKDIEGRTPYENNTGKLTCIEYIHNVWDNGVTIVARYDDNKRMYKYVCSGTIDGIDMVGCISKQLDKNYTEQSELDRMKSNSILF